MDDRNRLINIHRKIVELIDGERSLAVVLILEADGSTPQKVGVKAVIEGTGTIWGTSGATSS